MVYGDGGNSSPWTAKERREALSWLACGELPLVGCGHCDHLITETAALVICTGCLTPYQGECMECSPSAKVGQFAA